MYNVMVKGLTSLRESVMLDTVSPEPECFPLLPTLKKHTHTQILGKIPALAKILEALLKSPSFLPPQLPEFTQPWLEELKCEQSSSLCCCFQCHS